MRKVSFAEPCLRPKTIPVPKRLRGAKRAGIAFENALAKALPNGTHGQWFRYCDETGPGYCQTDILLVGTKNVVIVECKLSNLGEAQEQLTKLYIPVARVAYPNRQIRAVIALRHVTQVPESVQIHDKFSEAIWATREDKEFPIFHWLGKGPIG